MNWLRRIIDWKPRVQKDFPMKPLVPDDGIYIMTGSYSLDGGETVRSGFPLTKTNIAISPNKKRGEIECRTCDGDGWDANSGGQTYICDTCHGTGVEDGNALCVCGHHMYEHYLGQYSCHFDDLDLYAEAGHGRILHPDRHDKEPRPCLCEYFQPELKGGEYED